MLKLVAYYKRMNKMAKRVLICGNYGIGNLGDEAILAGIIRLVQSASPSAKIAVFSSNRKITSRYFAVNTVDFFPAGIRSVIKSVFSIWKSIREVRKSDLIILGGGGLFADEKKMAVWIWFVQAFWFCLLRKKYFCLGQSVGPLNTKLGRSLTKFVFKNAAKITVRDQQSKDLLAKLDISDVKVLADPAYAIGYDIESFHKRSDYIVMTMRPWIKGNQTKISENLAKFIDWVFETYQITTKFVAFQESGESDNSRFEELKVFVKNKKTLEIVAKKIDYKEAVEIIAKSRFVIGMRLHSIIFAVLTKTPFLALSYSKKVRDFVETLGLNNYLQYEDLEFSNLKKQFEKIYKNRLELEKELEEQKLKYTYEVFKHETLLKELLA